MSDDSPLAGARLPLRRWPQVMRWLALLVFSLIFGGALVWVGLPAGFMLGPLAAVALLQYLGGDFRLPRFSTAFAQSVVGCLVARSITAPILDDLARHWPLFLAVAALSVCISLALGWTVGRLGVVPGTTAIWGMLPGVATVMILLSQSFNGDFRLVAFMQYIRVVMVAIAASLVALLLGAHDSRPLFGDLFPPTSMADLAGTGGIALVGGILGRISGVPGGVLLIPLGLGAMLNVLGWVHIVLPPVMLIAAYAIIGWNTGLSFTPKLIATASRLLLPSLGSALLLMTFSGFLAWLLTAGAHVDPLTAYLATSPGGIDAIAIIAAGSPVDVRFVMALQTMRVLLLLAVGPPAAKWIAKMLNRQLQGLAPFPEL